MSRPTKKCQLVGEIKPKAKALRHFKIEAVQKFDDSVLVLSLSQKQSTFKKSKFDTTQRFYKNYASIFNFKISNFCFIKFCPSIKSFCN